MLRQRAASVSLTLGVAFVLLPCAARAQDGEAPPPAPNTPAAPPAGYPPPPPPPGYLPPPGYAQPGYAPPPLPQPLPRPAGNVHDGFYLRTHLGGMSSTVSGQSATAGRLTYSGAGISLGIALGGALIQNLILFGNAFTVAAASPNLDQYGTSAATNGSFGLGGVGAGVAYYFEPINLYLSGTVAGLSFEVDGANGNTVRSSKTGVGFQAMVGKEWWVAEEWGLGVAAEFIAASMKDSDDASLTWTGTAGSLLFSATFN